MEWLSFWDYEFMRHALWAILLLVPLLSLLGTLVVNNGMAFFSDALGHSALTGVAIGVVAGVAQYEWVMIAFAVLFALVMNRIRHSHIASTDTVIGVFSSVGVALGLLLLSRNGHFANYQSLLIGDVLSITVGDLWLVGGVLVAAVVQWVVCFNGFHAISIHPAVARNKGIPVRLLDDVFVVMVAVVVMLAIRWVGLLLINAMLVLPAAAARNVSRSMRSFTLLSLVFGVFAGVVGLLFSWYNAVATGPMIILILAALFFGTLVMRRK